MTQEKLLLDYMIWADNVVFEILATLDDTEISQDLGNNTHSIQKRLIHVAEEHLGWYSDAKGEPIPDSWREIQNKSNAELIAYIREYHKIWLTYVNSQPPLVYSIQENDNLSVDLTLFELIFNLVNHASYHRGQIVTCLRVLGKEVKISDFFWYKINKARS